MHPLHPTFHLLRLFVGAGQVHGRGSGEYCGGSWLVHRLCGRPQRGALPLPASGGAVLRGGKHGA
eukprot:2005764-Pleurochrysis_carterae.AAC.4